MFVLIVDDEPDICGRIVRLLQYENIESVEAITAFRPNACWNKRCLLL
jgi:DNA-binding response OmpR family regulator